MQDGPRSAVAVGTTRPVRAGHGTRELRSDLLHAYAIFVAASVLVLICTGGLVTSNDAGLAVPDWPTSFGYNMFAFPLSRWLAPGGVRLEHSHRLVATGEGTLTILLALLMWRVEPRKWMRNLGYATVGAVVFQGVLGGLRVVLRADWIGIVHACFGQMFFALVAFIALATSRWWINAPAGARGAASLSRIFTAVAALIFVQLALGATMRHAHAGLSIRDFPTAYGHVWPPLDDAALTRINHERTEQLGLPATSAALIVLQMLHRLGAGIVAATVIFAAGSAWRRRANLGAGLLAAGLLGPVLIALQITAGIYTIWTNKAADVATTHVALGALSLVWAGLTASALARAGRPAARETVRVAPAPRLVEAGV